MPTPPPCTRLGRQCRVLDVTLRIGKLEEGQDSLDHEATWLLGHTERIDFGPLRSRRGELLVEAALHVPCKHLAESDGSASCRAHGFCGPAPAQPRRAEPSPGSWGVTGFACRGPAARSPRRPAVHVKAGLPVLGQNPCLRRPVPHRRQHPRARPAAGTCRSRSCATRDETRLEALVCSRQSPYLCKIERSGEDSLEAEMISACGYLDRDGVSCSLHGRIREDGRPAKPDLCSEWPEGRGPDASGVCVREIGGNAAEAGRGGLPRCPLTPRVCAGPALPSVS